MKIKRLNLDRWMREYPYNFSSHSLFEDEEQEKDTTYSKIQPIVFRDGWYKIGKKTWFENKYGAFSYDDVAMFDFTLKLLNHKSISKKEKQAMKFLINSGRLDKKTKNKFLDELYTQWIIEDLRSIKMEYRARRIKMEYRAKSY